MQKSTIRQYCLKTNSIGALQTADSADTEDASCKSNRNHTGKELVMEENLLEMIEDYEDTEPSYHDSNGQPDESASPEAATRPIDEAGNSTEVKVEDDDTSGESKKPVYEIRDGHLIKKVDGKEIPLANFDLEIVAQHIRMDEGNIVRRDFQVNLYLNGETVPLLIPSEDFCCHRLVNRIIENVGSGAIIYGNHKDLRIAAQELSPSSAPIKTITTSMGFNEQGAYLAPGMMISAEGINSSPEIDVDLSEGNFSRHLGFLPPNTESVSDLVKHLHDEFLQLKAHSVTYPLMGHVVLSAFASQLVKIGKQKPVMHLQGPSGSGKTFLGNLASSFYGAFDDRPLPWTSTANAIESEGFLFRDALFFIDDFKTAIVDSYKIIRIIQNSANSQGRARLSSGAGYKLAPMRGVRGLILSTGEDFISDVESVVGRTLLINVEPDQNQQAGAFCWRRRDEYRMLIPGLLQWLLSQDDWFGDFEDRVTQTIERLRESVSDLSNGTRVASNWALNAFGFELFVRFSRHLGITDDQRSQDLLNEYQEIMADHITAHADRLMLQDPVEVFFQVMSQKFAIGAVQVKDLSDQNSGRLIGKIRDNGNIVCLFPDPTLEVIYGHFRSVGKRLPFTKENLRDGLDRENLIIRSGPGRVTHQIRMNGSRLQAWQFDANQFKTRCGMLDS
jgi:hypothetical protein